MPPPAPPLKRLCLILGAVLLPVAASSLGNCVVHPSNTRGMTTARWVFSNVYFDVLLYDNIMWNTDGMDIMWKARDGEIYSLPWIFGGVGKPRDRGGEGGISHINEVSTCQPQTREGRVYTWLSF